MEKRIQEGNRNETVKQSTSYTQGSKPYEIKVFSQYSQKTVNNEKNIHRLKNWPDSTLLKPPVDEMWKEKTYRKL